MELPFTVEQFFGVFREYNEAVWPVQVLLTGLAVAALALIPLRRRWSDAGVSAILALLWAWQALAYHLAFFAAINPLAYGFAGLSLAGAAAFVWLGVVRRRLRFGFSGWPRTTVGAALLAFALLVYPVWSIYEGHRYPAMPTFGLPCPTTIFTIGLLAFAVRPYPRAVLVVPIMWSFVGAQAAFRLGVPQDMGLLVAGLIGLGLAMDAKTRVMGWVR